MRSFIASTCFASILLFTLTSCTDYNDPDVQAKNKIALENPQYVGTTKFGQKLYVSSISNGNTSHYVYMLGPVQTVVTQSKSPVTTVTINTNKENESQQASLLRELEEIDNQMASIQKQRNDLVQQLE